MPDLQRSNLTQRRKARKGMQSQLCALAPLREVLSPHNLLTGKVRVKVDEAEEVAANA